MLVRTPGMRPSYNRNASLLLFSKPMASVMTKLNTGVHPRINWLIPFGVGSLSLIYFNSQANLPSARKFKS